MALNKLYSRINWENEPSTKTPLNETNLNKIDSAIDEIDNRVISLDTTKATKVEVSELKSDLDELNNRIPLSKHYVVINYNSLIENSAFTNSGDIAENSGKCVISDFIKVNKYFKITWIAYCGISIATYSNNNVASFIGFDTTGYDISSNFEKNIEDTDVKYIRIAFNKNYTSNTLLNSINLLVETISDYTLVTDDTTNIIKYDVNNIKDTMIKIYNQIELNVSNLRLGYGFDENGNVVKKTNAVLDVFIPIYKGIKFYCDFAGVSIALYSDKTNDTFKRFAYNGFKSGLQIVELNENEKYAKICFSISSVTEEKFNSFVFMTMKNVLSDVDNTILQDNTISNYKIEKMSHGSQMVYKDGYFYNIYLCDDTQTVESPANNSIYCNLAKISICDNNDIEFFKVAKIGDNIGTITISDRPPYEPNILLINNELYCYFNCMIDGTLTYVCRKFNIDTQEFENMIIPMTIDGNTFNVTNVLNSYNSLVSGNNTLTDFMITSRIININNEYYAFISGYGNYKGILIKSTNGINWISVSVPNTNLVTNVREFQIEYFNSKLHCLLRNNTSYIISCLYDLTTDEWSEFKVILNSIQSRPQIITVNDELYRMCNYENISNVTEIATRSKAILENFNGKWNELKSFILNSGIHYYSFCKVGASLYMAYSTDERNLNISQARSNIKLHRIY